MGYYNGEDRDTRCALDVGKMSALGRFDKEIELYGCAYSGNGRVFYCISRFEKAVWQVVEQSADQHIYPTPVESYIKRVSVPAGMYEEILEQTKLEMAKKLKCQFGEIYF